MVEQELDIYNKLINNEQNSSDDEKNISKKYNKYSNNLKINRFISTCKRCYILSQNIKNHDNIIRSKCKTNIRDITNTEFDNLLKLLENTNKDK